MGERKRWYEQLMELVCNRLVLPIVLLSCHLLIKNLYSLFQILKKAYPGLVPERIEFDYERAVKNAVQTVYSDIAVEGDSFHSVQAITRRLKKKRISQLYVNEVEVYEQVRLLLTPYFVPFNQMVSFIHDVVKRLITAQSFKGQGATLTGEEKRPLFKREHSNLYQATIEGRPRHNNHMESDNAKLNKLIKENTSMWDMMLGLCSAIRGDYRLLYNEWVAGIVQPRRIADVAKDRNILNAVRLWDDASRGRMSKVEWARNMMNALGEVE
uniref:Transposase n=1 Tax=Ditylenchus dipsaci TaxID=166011 RepID=A0A915ESS6_9BILA